MALEGGGTIPTSSWLGRGGAHAPGAPLLPPPMYLATENDKKLMEVGVYVFSSEQWFVVRFQRAKLQH